MRQVKLIYVHVTGGSYGDYDLESLVANSGITDWEEISDADYTFLKDNMHKLKYSLERTGLEVVLLEKDMAPIATHIKSIAAWIEADREAVRLEKEKKEAALAERRRKKLLKEAESEIKLLEELSKKHPNWVGFHNES